MTLMAFSGWKRTMNMKSAKQQMGLSLSHYDRQIPEYSVSFSTHRIPTASASKVSGLNRYLRTGTCRP